MLSCGGEQMTRSDYLSNSAKLLMICSAFLFSVNLLSFVSMYAGALTNVVAKLTDICFYGMLVLGFLAFNGEGIAYKHARQLKHKRVTAFLKVLLLSAFFIRFIKTPVEGALLSTSADTVVGALSRLGLGVFNNVSSYGFLLTVVALWCIFRDGINKKLVGFEAVALASGVAYNGFKIFNHAITKYGFNYFGEGLAQFFQNGLILNILCLVHFMADIIMFAMILKHYNAKALVEQNEKIAIVRKMVTSRKIYKTDCFGLDTMEDDYFSEGCGDEA